MHKTTKKLVFCRIVFRIRKKASKQHVKNLFIFSTNTTTTEPIYHTRTLTHFMSCTSVLNLYTQKKRNYNIYLSFERIFPFSTKTIFSERKGYTKKLSKIFSAKKTFLFPHLLFILTLLYNLNLKLNSNQK